MLKEKFTQQFFQLCVKQNIGVADSLKLMAERKTGAASFFQLKIQKTAKFLFEQMSGGECLSSALKSCLFITFDEVYVQAISFAEMNGNLKEILSFLNERCKRHIHNRNKLIEACVYPFFVIFAAITGCIGLSFISEGFDIKSRLFEYSGILIFVCVLTMFCIVKAIGENKTYEAFYISGFLIKSGMNVSNAIGCAQVVVGEESKIGRRLSEAKEKIEYGMGLEKAFEMNNELSDALYFADKAGKKCDVFERIAEQIGEKDEARRRICLQLVEPLFIVITGSFLMILVINFFMPLMNNTNWF